MRAWNNTDKKKKKKTSSKSQGWKYSLFYISTRMLKHHHFICFPVCHVANAFKTSLHVLNSARFLKRFWKMATFKKYTGWLKSTSPLLKYKFIVIFFLDFFYFFGFLNVWRFNLYFFPPFFVCSFILRIGSVIKSGQLPVLGTMFKCWFSYKMETIHIL